MKRKLVKQGVRALTITLPSSWIQKNNLSAGDEIELEEIDNVLLVSTDNVQTAKEITVDMSGFLPRLADRFLARAYQKGYDKIIVKFDDPQIMVVLKQKVPELLGNEILHTTKNTLEIQVISQHLDLDFDVLLRRGILLLLDMSETCYNAWKTTDIAALKNIFEQDYDVNRFMYFCLRHLNKTTQRASFGRSILYYLIESLEDLGDELKKLSLLLAATKSDPHVLVLLKQVNTMFRLSYDFFYKPDKTKATEAFTLYQQISASVDTLFEKKKDPRLMKALLKIQSISNIIYHLTTMRLDTLKELGG